MEGGGGCKPIKKIYGPPGNRYNLVIYPSQLRELQKREKMSCEILNYREFEYFLSGPVFDWGSTKAIG